MLEERTPCSMCCCTPLNKILMVVFMILLLFAILFGNSLTLAVVLGTKHFHTPQGYLKASLAVADLSVGVFVVPLSVYAEISLMLTDTAPGWTVRNSQHTPFHPCTVIGPVFAGCTLVSITTVFLLTIERSIAVLKPLHKDAVITRRRTSMLIVCSWTGSFFLALSPLIFSKQIALEYNACSRMCNYALGAKEFPRQAWHILLLFPVFDFTLLVGTVVINIVSFTTIRHHSKKRRRLAQAGCQSTSGPSFSDIKAAKTIGALTLVFTASFTPVAVFVVGNVSGNEWCSFSFVAFWILAASSCWNVIIYSVRDQKFRLRARQLLVFSKIKNSP
ncbi:trace amine-associated receptor 9 [Pangasianodon hypophthalmus]|uniref:trace amine-associated receptor 9 n=1 Tax=Pangasianodon hypophthalmus TaxID=310915 RepID=UPI0023081439|nr:trace amine-associated receptor 9 [Pangasianodon hypophthalmus]